LTGGELLEVLEDTNGKYIEIGAGSVFIGARHRAVRSFCLVSVFSQSWLLGDTCNRDIVANELTNWPRNYGKWCDSHIHSQPILWIMCVPVAAGSSLRDDYAGTTISF
jgi:hypothetical protein